MEKIVRFFGIALLLALLPPWAVASPLWTDSPTGLQAKNAVNPYHAVRRVTADMEALTTTLDAAPMESGGAARAAVQPLLMELPMPDGAMMLFSIVESPIMPADEANRIGYRSYRASAVNTPAFTGRLDLGPHGFHGLVQTDKGTVYINPVPKSGAGQYHSFYKRDYIRNADMAFSCGAQQVNQSVDDEDTAISEEPALFAARSSDNMLTYNIAVAATLEYSNAVGGGVPATTALEIASVINRVNEIYQRDLAITLNLIANDGDLVSTDSMDFSSNDPITLFFTTEIQGFIENDPAAASYDIGHLFTAGSGGVAGLGVVCDGSAAVGTDTHKSKGITGIGYFIDVLGDVAFATDDPFYIDYVAHEIGHQFGANHTFNGTTASCGGGNRNASTAYEPGSGSTIMGYAGICDAENVQTLDLSDSTQGASDATFHAGSIEQILAYTRSGAGSTCDTLASTGNTAPSMVEAGASYVIPALTPFALTGSATDTDPLTYQWDQMDAGAATTASTFGNDLCTNALFRSYEPSTNPVRTFPDLTDLLDGVTSRAETLPTSTRDLNFRLTVRDGNGGVDEDDVMLTVDGNSGPFRVLQPNTAVSLDTNMAQVIEWNSACTEQAPVNCANVDILLSTDGGMTFSDVLAANTANDGSESVTIPFVAPVTTARIKIACSNNIFFDVSDVDFSFDQGSGSALVLTGAGGSSACNIATDCATTSSEFDVEPNDTPDEAVEIEVPITITGTVNSDSDLLDYYVFTSEGGAYTFTLSDYADNDLDLFLLDSEVTEVFSMSTSAADTSEVITIGLIAGETYYIVVNAYETSGTDSPYTLEMARNPPPPVVADDGGALTPWTMLAIPGLLYFRAKRRFIPTADTRA